MAVCTLNQFKRLIKSKDWSRKEVFERISKHDDLILGCAYKVSRKDDIEISFREFFVYESNDHDPLWMDRFDSEWEIKGLTVIDEFKQIIESKLLDVYINYDFSDIDYDVPEFLSIMENK